MFNPFRIFSDLKRMRGNARPERRTGLMNCPICGAAAKYYDTVDFNKSCEEVRGMVLPRTSVAVDYYLCDDCGFCFAPELGSWAFDDFEKYIYNDGYAAVDPDYKFERPLTNAALLDNHFGASKERIRHLDYGGGSGLLSKALRERAWPSSTYDPFVDRELRVDELGKFDLVTAFEVFEHVPDSADLIDTLAKLCKPDGLILFTTLLSDGNIGRAQKLDWWYAAPRNGHISLFSQKSLQLLMARRDLQCVSFSNNFHAAFRQIPDWAQAFMQALQT